MFQPSVQNTKPGWKRLKTADLPKETDSVSHCVLLYSDTATDLILLKDQIYLWQKQNSLGRLDVLAHPEVVSCYSETYTVTCRSSWNQQGGWWDSKVFHTPTRDPSSTCLWIRQIKHRVKVMVGGCRSLSMALSEVSHCSSSLLLLSAAHRIWSTCCCQRVFPCMKQTVKAV